MKRSTQTLIGILALMMLGGGVGGILIMASDARVSALGYTNTVTPKFTVNSACDMSVATASGWNSTTGYKKDVSVGTTESGIGGTTMTVNCNNSGGWKIQAVGAGTGSPNTSMVGSSNGGSIATGTSTGGTNASSWAVIITVDNTSATGSGTATVQNSFGSYHAIPASATSVATVAKGTSTVSGAKVTAKYRVWVNPTQIADTYTGKVTYTITSGAS